MAIFTKTGLFAILFFVSITEAFSQQTFPRGLDFDDVSYQQDLKKARTRALEVLPAEASIKQYSPYPKSQGSTGTCTAWASAYCGRTIVDAIKNNWTDRDFITSKAYSPAFLFRLLQPVDDVCVGGSNISTAFSLMKDQGVLYYDDLPESCTPYITQAQIDMASKGKIKDFFRLFDPGTSDPAKIQSIKKSISERKPVVFGMVCPPSFFDPQEVWQPTEEPLQSYGGHAMCVVGYDDNKFGGVFEIQNSWGPSWGNSGYIYIKYDDLARFTKYAYEFVDIPVLKPDATDLSGQIRFVLSTGKEMNTNLFMSTRGLKVVSSKRYATTPGPITIYKTPEPYKSGTQFRMYITNNEPAYVYAISSDLTTEVTKIFPYEEGISAALTDKRSDVAIPDEDHYIEFDDKAGRDFLCVLYSKTELNIDELVKKISSQQGSFNDRVFKVIANDIVSPKNIQFSADKISFKAKSMGKKLVALMVELDHK